MAQKKESADRPSRKVHPLFTELYLSRDQEEEYEEEKSGSRRRRASVKLLKRR